MKSPGGLELPPITERMDSNELLTYMTGLVARSGVAVEQHAGAAVRALQAELGSQAAVPFGYKQLTKFGKKVVRENIDLDDDLKAVFTASFDASFDAMQERNRIIHSRWAILEGDPGGWRRSNFGVSVQGGNRANLEQFLLVWDSLEMAKWRTLVIPFLIPWPEQDQSAYAIDLAIARGWFDLSPNGQSVRHHSDLSTP